MSRIIQLSDLHVLPVPQRVSGVLNTYALLVDTIDTLLADWQKSDPLMPWLSLGISPTLAMRKVTSCSANKFSAYLPHIF